MTAFMNEYHNIMAWRICWVPYNINSEATMCFIYSLVNPDSPKALFCRSKCDSSLKKGEGGFLERPSSLQFMSDSHQIILFRSDKVNIICANHVSVLDHLAVDLVEPCVLPSVWDIPSIIRWYVTLISLT